MDLFPKFIIEGDSLIISKVQYHHQLVTDKANVKGGGWFRLALDKKEIVFYGDSHDFGKATLEDVEQCIKSGNVFSDKMKYRNISDSHQFKYDTGTELISIDRTTLPSLTNQ